MGFRPEAAWLQAHLGLLARVRREFPAARCFFQGALVDARAAGCRIEEVEALINQGRLEYLEGNLSVARAEVEQGVAIAGDIGYQEGLILGTRTLGEVAISVSDFAAAREFLEASVEHARALGDKWRLAWAPLPLGYLLLDEGDEQRACAIWRESLLAWRDIGYMNQLVNVLEAFAYQAFRHRDLERAICLVAAAEAIRSRDGVVMLPEAQIWLERWLPAARKRLAPVQMFNTTARGAAMTLAVAIAYALNPPEWPRLAAHREPVSNEHGLLTAREREVVDLIASGASDREIASSLVISKNTAHAHVRNILSKLGLQSRVQVAAWAASAKNSQRK